MRENKCETALEFSIWCNLVLWNCVSRNEKSKCVLPGSRVEIDKERGCGLMCLINLNGFVVEFSSAGSNLLQSVT